MRLLLPLLVLACLVACSSTDTNVATGGQGAGVSCEGDARAMTYTASMSAQGKSKAFQIVLVNSTPAPPARGNNTWTVKVVDAQGAPVNGATLTVKPFMPDHGHGTSVNATITANADGTFSVTPLYLFMAGLWQVTFGIEANGISDSAVLSFCIEG